MGDGKIDINLADADTIELVTGVSAATANQILKYRWGPDGKPFTLDDRVYNSMDEVRAALGMSAGTIPARSGLAFTHQRGLRMSTGIIAGYEKKIFVIATRNTVPVSYLSWQEK